jgi:hypothetical protein
MFWGVCNVANCAIARGHPHCGLCPEVPCATLQGFFDDPEHGDNGERLANPGMGAGRTQLQGTN